MSKASEGDRPTAAGWLAEHVPDQNGRTFVVTGANSGLGYETARALAARGGHVIMTARDQERGERAVESVLAETPDAAVELRLLDLADLDSVRAFANTVRTVDALINNAGVGMPKHEKTAQGYELQFGVNHLAHFALTGLLLRTLALGRDPRVVTVSSAAHKRGRIHFDDLHGEHKYGQRKYYAQSKLANVVFGLELHRRLRANGLVMSSVLAHPGLAATKLSSGSSGLSGLMVRMTEPMLAQSAELGALPQLYAATGPDVESGQFIGPDGRGEVKGFPTVVEPLDAARDRELAKRLWDISEELTGVEFHLAP
jgi:NAD(P)-dependent dehydrogenase (short-subunit alcohol dehydrogenase family)